MKEMALEREVNRAFLKEEYLVSLQLANIVTTVFVH